MDNPQQTVGGHSKHGPQSKDGGKAAAQLSSPACPSRRTGLLAILIGGFLTLFPFLTGLAVFVDPLRRRGAQGNWIRIATLDALPDDGIPRQFEVIADKQDAWNKYLNQPIGAVYLIRQPGSEKVSAFNATCPHAGCFIGYQSQQKHFGCPCHKSVFDLQGIRLTKRSPSPRDMDALEAEVRVTSDGANAGTKELWVKYTDFRIAIEEKIPKV
jgi:menaquinol-cytochrome c reductase iron-sulfur subunit